MHHVQKHVRGMDGANTQYSAQCSRHTLLYLCLHFLTFWKVYGVRAQVRPTSLPCAGEASVECHHCGLFPALSPCRSGQSQAACRASTGPPSLPYPHSLTPSTTPECRFHPVSRNERCLIHLPTVSEWPSPDNNVVFLNAFPSALIMSISPQCDSCWTSSRHWCFF